jgi:hypothetical protein
MGFDFNRYLEVFNKNDDELLTREYFTEDVIIDGPDRTLHGRQAWLDLLKFNHRGVRETLHPITVVREADNMMLEANALFTPSIDRPDFLLAPLKAGQPLKMRFFASYRIRGNQIAHLTLGWWPPGLRSI